MDKADIFNLQYLAMVTDQGKSDNLPLLLPRTVEKSGYQVREYARHFERSVIILNRYHRIDYLRIIVAISVTNALLYFMILGSARLWKIRYSRRNPFCGP